jgi:hypothetical protein
MEVIRVDGLDEEWDSFVWESPAGTIFSTLRFLSYHPPGRFQQHNLAVKESGNILCVMAGGMGGGGAGECSYRSPVGASFGGPVLPDFDVGRALEAIEALTGELRREGVRGVEIALPPPCYSRELDQSLAYALGHAGYRVSGREATMVVDLATYEEGSLDGALRRSLKKAEREGIRLGRGGDPRKFYAVLAANLASKGAKPTHSLQELTRLFDLFPDRFVLVEAVLGGEVVGGCLVVVCNTQAALAFYICDDGEHRPLRVAEAAIAGAADLLKRSGCRYFDLGTVSMEGEVNWGLVRFKSKFGGRVEMRERYCLSIE